MKHLPDHGHRVRYSSILYSYSCYTVRCEMGHGSDDVVNKVYSHLGDVRHGSDAVEYRVSQHLEALGDRLKGLGLALP